MLAEDGLTATIPARACRARIGVAKAGTAVRAEPGLAMNWQCWCQSKVRRPLATGPSHPRRRVPESVDT